MRENAGEFVVVPVPPSALVPCVIPLVVVVQLNGGRSVLSFSSLEVFDWETTWKAGTTHDHWAASWLACAARDKQVRPGEANTEC